MNSRLQVDVDGESEVLELAGCHVTLSAHPTIGEWLRNRFSDFNGGLRWPVDLGVELPLSISVAGGTARVAHPSGSGSIDLSRGHVDIPSDGDSVPNPVFADALVRIAMASQLAKRGGLLLHASAVVRADGAWVVFGASGAGKSTVASALGFAIADELTVLTREDGRWIVHGTPWWNGAKRRAPLRGLIWLVRAEPPQVRPVGGAELLSGLLGETGRYLSDAEFDRQVFHAAADLAVHGAVRVAAAERQHVSSIRGVIDGC